MNKKLIIIVALAGAITVGLWLNSCTINKSYGSKTNNILEVLADRALLNIKNGKAKIDMEKWEINNQIFIEQGIYSLNILKTNGFFIVLKKKSFIDKPRSGWKIEEQIKSARDKSIFMKIKLLYCAAVEIVKKNMQEEKIKKLKEGQEAFPTN